METQQSEGSGSLSAHHAYRPHVCSSRTQCSMQIRLHLRSSPVGEVSVPVKFLPNSELSTRLSEVIVSAMVRKKAPIKVKGKVHPRTDHEGPEGK